MLSEWLTGGVAVQVVVDPQSNRLELLAPFSKWNGSDIEGAQVRPTVLASSETYCTACGSLGISSCYNCLEVSVNASAKAAGHGQQLS